MPHTQATQEIGTMDDRMQACIAACWEAHEAATMLVPHCLGKGGPHAEKGHIRQLLDLADLTAANATLMLRQSPVHTRMCGITAEVAEAAAGDCERFRDDRPMQRAAELFRACGRSCREIAGGQSRAPEAPTRAA